MSVSAVILELFYQCYSYVFVMLLQYFLQFLKNVIGANFTPSVQNLHDLYVMEA